MTIEEVAKLKGCSQNSVYNAIWNGQLNAEKRNEGRGRGGTWFIASGDAKRWPGPGPAGPAPKAESELRRRKIMVTLTDREHAAVVKTAKKKNLPMSSVVRQHMGLEP